jgi:hypothetical protein
MELICESKNVVLKAFTNHLVGSPEYTHSIRTGNQRLGYFFLLILKGLHDKINKKLLDAA